MSLSKPSSFPASNEVHLNIAFTVEKKVAEILTGFGGGFNNYIFCHVIGFGNACIGYYDYTKI